jgi:hypothetical protein
MKREADRERKDDLIVTRRDAGEWLLLAYSLGHPYLCGCENCLVARRIVALRRHNEPALA